MTVLAHEIWLANKLSRPTLFDGVTTTEQRRERVREHIVANDLGHIIAGKRHGVPEDISTCFERIYGQPLETAENQQS